MNQQSEHRTLTGKTAIITGASRGIGAAIALRLAQLGANVTIDYLSNNERAQQTAQRRGMCDAGSSRPRSSKTNLALCATL